MDHDQLEPLRTELLARMRKARELRIVRDYRIAQFAADLPEAKQYEEAQREVRRAHLAYGAAYSKLRADRAASQPA